MSDTHVQGNECLVDVLENHSVEKLAAEVQTGCRCGNCTLVLCEDGLEVLCVLRCDIFLHPVWNRSLAVAEKGLLELLVTAVIKESQRSSSRCGVVDHFGYEAVVISEIELVADTDLSRRINDYVPKSLLAVELSEEENFDVGSCLLLVSLKTGWEYLCVVEDECVSLTEIFDDVLEELMLDFSCLLVEDHEFALISPSRRLCCDPVGRKSKLEL